MSKPPVPIRRGRSENNLLENDELKLYETPNHVDGYLSLRLWCRDCGRVAERGCELHDTRGLHRFRREQAEMQVRALERQKEALDAVVALEEAVLAKLEVTLQRNRERQRNVAKCLLALCGGLDPWDSWLAEAGRLMKGGDMLDQDLQQLQSQKSVNIHSSGMGGTVSLEDQPVLRLVMLHLRRTGALETTLQHATEEEESLDLLHISSSGPQEMKGLKCALLLSSAKVRTIRRLCCYEDPKWALALLRKHAAQLEDVHLTGASREHLQLLMRCRAMPHLRRLDLLDCDEVLWSTTSTPSVSKRSASTWSLASLSKEEVSKEESASHTDDGEAPEGLRWLRLVALPLPTVRTLLRACGGTLEHLEIAVGLPATTPAVPEPIQEQPQREQDTEETKAEDDETKTEEAENTEMKAEDEKTEDEREDDKTEDEQHKEKNVAKDEWPLTCHDLPALLRECGGLPRLRQLVLHRYLSPSHTHLQCLPQIAALMMDLPGCKVTCSLCRDLCGSQGDLMSPSTPPVAGDRRSGIGIRRVMSRVRRRFFGSNAEDEYITSDL